MLAIHSVTHPDGVCGLLLGALAPLVRLQLLQALLQLLTVLLLLLKQSRDALKETMVSHGIQYRLYTEPLKKVGPRLGAFHFRFSCDNWLLAGKQDVFEATKQEVNTFNLRPTFKSIPVDRI